MRYPIPLVAALILSFGLSASGQNIPGAPAVQGKIEQPQPAMDKVLTAVSGDGENLVSVQQTDNAVLFSNRADAAEGGKAPSSKGPRKWYLVFGAPRGKDFADVKAELADPYYMDKKTAKFLESWLEEPFFVDPPSKTPKMGAYYPYPSQPIHLTNDPERPAGKKPVYLFTWPSEAGDGNARQVFAEGRPAPTKDKPYKFECIRPILWWGEGVTEDMVEEGCRKGNFDFVCEGSGAAAPSCNHNKKDKKDDQPDPDR